MPRVAPPEIFRTAACSSRGPLDVSLFAITPVLRAYEYTEAHLIFLARSKYEYRYRCCNCSVTRNNIPYLIRSRIVIAGYSRLIVSAFLSARCCDASVVEIYARSTPIRRDNVAITRIILPRKLCKGSFINECSLFSLFLSFHF